MRGSLDEPPVVLRGPRWQWRRLRALAIIVVALGVLFNRGAGRYAVPSWVVIGYGLLATLAVAANLLVLAFPPTVEIGPAGLLRKALWRRRRWAWEDFADFRPVQYANVEWVGFQRSAVAKPLSLLQQVNGRLTGADGVLFPGYEIGAAALSDLLNAARRRWARLEAGAATAPQRLGLGARAAAGFLVVLAGRLNRRSYWLGMAALAAIASATLVLPRATGVQTAGALIALVVAQWLGRSRLRDLGVSPWWILLTFPAALVGGLLGMIAEVILRQSSASLAGSAIGAGLLLFGPYVAIGFLPGQRRRNRYGPPPGGGEAEAVASSFS